MQLTLSSTDPNDPGFDPELAAIMRQTEGKPGTRAVELIRYANRSSVSTLVPDRPKRRGRRKGSRNAETTRLKQKARALEAKGLPHEAIAARVGRKRSTVTGWLNESV